LIKYIPNILTVIRIVLIPFFVLPFFYTSMYGYYSIFIGALLFIILASTDSIDGYLARKYNVVSDFGKYWDPLADKLLVYAAFFLLSYFGWFPLWVILLLLSRETLVTLHRSVALAKGNAIAAVNSGKIKTTVQMITVIATLVYITNEVYHFIKLPVWVSTIPIYLIFLTLAATVYSGIDYFMKNKKALRGHEFADGLIQEYLSVFGVGRFPVASGTAGSVLAAAVGYIWYHSFGLYNLIWIVGIIVTGALCAQRSRQLFGSDDAKEIVLDEVAGQAITLLFLPFSWKAYVLGFVLFRIFDILKPFPVCVFDRMKNGWGIMLDDVVAGLYAGVIGMLLIRYIPWFMQ